jgi:hypothetical protein
MAFLGGIFNNLFIFNKSFFHVFFGKAAPTVKKTGIQPPLNPRFYVF